MNNIINNNILLGEIRRQIKEELQKEIPKKQLESLWGYLNQIRERVKILEEKEKMIVELVDLAVRKEMNDVYKLLDKFRKRLNEVEISIGNKKAKIEGLNRNEK